MASNADLMNQWEWNNLTGDPVNPQNDTPNSRFCPTVLEMDAVDARRVVGAAAKDQLLEFMTSDRTLMTTTFDVSKNNDQVVQFLCLLRRLDFKKISVTYRGRGYVQLTKLDRDTPFTGELDLKLNPLRNKASLLAKQLVSDINFNALHGFLGPGTFSCFKSKCNLCSHVGQTATVQLGPHGELPLTKRATCSTKNAVYVGVCLKCEEEGTFACYFGETSKALHDRYRGHLSDPCNRQSILKNGRNFKTVSSRQDEVERVIQVGEDPNETLRDWFTHVTKKGIHPGHQRISVVDIIPNTFRRQNRERNLVEERMMGDNNIDYLGMGRGCLNTYCGI